MRNLRVESEIKLQLHLNFNVIVLFVFTLSLILYVQNNATKRYYTFFTSIQDSAYISHHQVVAYFS